MNIDRLQDRYKSLSHSLGFRSIDSYVQDPTVSVDEVYDSLSFIALKEHSFHGGYYFIKNNVLDYVQKESLKLNVSEKAFGIALIDFLKDWHFDNAESIKEFAKTDQHKYALEFAIQMIPVYLTLYRHLNK